MADPHDIDIAVEDAPPSSGEVPNPPDPGGGMAEQLGGNHDRGGGCLGSDHSVTERDVEDRPVGEIVPDDGDEGHWGATTLPGVSLSAKGNANRNGAVFQLVEADHYGAWFKAIEAKDCLSLGRFLKGKEDDASRVALCLETGEGGRTALHVAALQGRFSLAKQLIDLMCNAYGPSGTSESPSRELHEFTGAKDGRSGLTALEMANDMSRSTSISQYIRYVRMEPQEKEKYGGMCEAYQGTQWNTALAEGDCSTLWSLLRFNSRFLLQTCNTTGLSVLDVAIVKDNKELVETVVLAFGPGGDKITWPSESYFPSELTWDQIAVRHFDEDPRFSGPFRLKNLAKLGGSIAETGRSLGSISSAMQLAEEFRSSAEIKGLLLKGKVFKKLLDGKKFQLVEADHDGPWFKAIETKDHISLWRILKGKEDDVSRVALCLETGEDGRTALHVAAMQGCFRLAKQLIDLICHAYDPSGISEIPSRELNEFTGAKDGRSGQTALDMAKDMLQSSIFRNTSIFHYIRYVRMEPQEEEKHGGMLEACEGSMWDTALAQRDCDELWRLLQHNLRFFLETCSATGLSVLDVAIMKDDEKLVEMVVEAFDGGGDKILWPPELYFPSEFTWEQIAERHFDEDPRFSGRFSLENSAKLGVPITETGRILGPITSAVQLAEEYMSSERIKWLLSKVGKHVERSTVDGEEFKKVRDGEVFQFVDAEHDGAWFKAIEARDCLSLMTLLQSLHTIGGDALCVSYCCKTGVQGRTALHVAAMQGCFRLAKQLIDLICEKYPWSENLTIYNEYYDVYRKECFGYGKRREVYLSEAAFKFTRAEDGRSGLTAFEMANDIIGNTSISQYMLYVGMKPEEKKDEKCGGMFEAYPGTEWHTALVQGDCSSLQRLLRLNSHFLLQTCSTGKGFSVLDVAIMKNDKELVETVVRAFGPARDKISWAQESYFPSELTWEQIARRLYDENFRFHDFYSSSNCANVLGLFHVKTRSPRSVSSDEDLAERFGISVLTRGSLGEVGVMEGGGEDFHSNLLGILYAEGVFESGDTELLESRLPEYRSLGKLANVIQGRWNSEWTAGFLADVDYNFEDKSSLRFSILRFHYAFKHSQLCKEFIDDIVYGEYENLAGTDVLADLFTMCDGQGRPPFHTMVDHDLKMVSRNASFYRALVNGCDARGRSSTFRAITKQFLEKETMISDLCVQIYKDHLSYMKQETKLLKHQVSLHHGAHSLHEWLLISTIFYQDEGALRCIIEKNEASVLETLFDGYGMKSFDEEFVQTKTLLVAAASGNQAILRLCLKKFNPMIEDCEGKTALHYAADANMFKYFSLPLSFFCSIEDRRKVEEQWVERRKDETQSNGNLNTNQGPNQNLQSTTYVGRRACVLMLRQAGVDLSQEDKKGNIPDPGSSTDASFQTWWYDTLDKDSVEKKNSFNQAGNALSVVGTLVAATSYIGPLQPPLSYDSVTGYVETSKLLVKVFMVSNTLAFYLAVASVMFAVVPSLPMPQEGVLEELRRARHTVSSSLFLLLTSIGCILVSFAAASAVVVDGEHYYGASDLLLKPSVIGWFFCLIAMVSFCLRVMRLVFYRNSVVRRMYKFSFSAFCKKIGSLITSWTIIFCLSVLWWISTVFSTILVHLPVVMYKRQSIRNCLKKMIEAWPHEYEMIKARYTSDLLRLLTCRE